MQIKGMRVAVTGGAGFIGSHLVEALLLRGNKVAVIDNFFSGRRENLAHLKTNLSVLEADVRDAKAMESALDDVEVVFHLATHCVRLSLEDPRVNHEVNATGTLNVLMAAKKAKARRFVYCSSSEVFGDVSLQEGGPNGILLNEKFEKLPTTIYGASKLVGEHYTLSFHELYGVPSIIVRPFNSYGPRSNMLGAYGEVIPRFAVWIKNKKPPVLFGDGSQTRDFTYVLDTAEGLIRSAECDALLGDDINIAFGKQVAVRELVDIINRHWGTQVSPTHGPERPGDIHRLGADNSKATRLLKWRPKIGIEQGIGRYLSWLEETGADWEQWDRALEPCNFRLHQGSQA